MRRILHIDMDAFFAAVEQQRRPELSGKPVVIGGQGDPSRRGVVSTANYEARKFGVHSGMPLRTAYKLCPQAVYLPVDYEAYSRISAVIKEVLREVSPIMEDVGIDEAYLEVTDSDDSDEAIARRIKEGIREKTGLTCSVGIAPNKLLAKIASDMQKPDGVTILRENDIESRFWPLAVRKLYGVGPKTEASLKEMGIETIGQLAATAPRRARRPFRQFLRQLSARCLAGPRRQPPGHPLGTEVDQPRDDLSGGCEQLADNRPHPRRPGAGGHRGLEGAPVPRKNGHDKDPVRRFYDLHAGDDDRRLHRFRRGDTQSGVRLSQADRARQKSSTGGGTSQRVDAVNLPA